MKEENNDLFNEELSVKADLDLSFDINSNEEQSLGTENMQARSSWFKPPKPTRVDWPLSADNIVGFEGANPTSSPGGYLIDATIKRQPHGNDIRYNDIIYMSFWCSGKTQGWYSRVDGKSYNGNQTGWIPAGPNAQSNNAAVVWIPTPDYNPQVDTIVHSLFLMRLSGNTQEVAVWRPGNGAPFPYTGNDRLKPSNPSEDFQVRTARRVFRISPNNPTGLELWGRPLYRPRIK